MNLASGAKEVSINEDNGNAGSKCGLYYHASI